MRWRYSGSMPAIASTIRVAAVLFRKKLSTVAPTTIAKIVRIGSVEEILSRGATKLEIVIPNTHIATKLKEICSVGGNKTHKILFSKLIQLQLLWSTSMADITLCHKRLHTVCAKAAGEDSSRQISTIFLKSCSVCRVVMCTATSNLKFVI